MKNGIAGLTALWVVLLCSSFVFAKGEKKEQAHLGVYADEVTSDIAADYGVETGRGVLVEDVVSDSPADEAGLRSNDILLTLDGATLTGPSELRVQISKHKPGDKVSLVFKRGGQERTATVELTERDSEVWTAEGLHENMLEGLQGLGDKVHAMAWNEDNEEKDHAFAGVVTQSLGEGLKDYFKVEDGALISEVVEDSPAEKAGLKAGDVIIKIGDRTIDDEDDVSKAIRKHSPDDEVDFEVMRDGKKMTFKVKLTERGEFYGETPAPDMGNFAAPAVPAVPPMAWTPQSGGNGYSYSYEMKNLDGDLQQMHEDLQNLDDIDVDLSIDPKPTIIRLNLDQATSIQDHGWWKKSWNDTKTRVQEEFEQLKENFQRLKQELLQLQNELKERMS